MRCPPLWPLVMACTASAHLLFGTGTVWRALVCDLGLNTIYPIDLGPIPTPESAVTGINGPSLVTITPDATRAPLTASLHVVSLNLATSPISIAVFSSVPDPSGPVALTPDGSRVYFTDRSYNVQVLNTSDLSTIATIPQFEFGVPLVSIALSPNKPEGYITTDDVVVFVINTDTNTVSETFFILPGSANSGPIAVTPDGSEAYVCDVVSNTVYCITLSDGTISSITGAAGDRSVGIAIAPDGTAVYVLQNGSPNVLTKISTSTHTVVGTFAVPPELISPSGIAITPDGNTACIIDQGNAVYPYRGQYAAFLDTTTGASSSLQLSTDDHSTLWGIAITPDQAPTAAFTYVAHTTSVAFDASSSSSPVGGIALYAWDFGDGQTAATTSPTISHTFSTSNSYPVTLTVTNTAGTSTKATYTGQMVSNNGGRTATTCQTVTVFYAGVAEFHGKVKRKCKKKQVILKMKWSKALMPQAKEFQIFARGKMVAAIGIHRKHKKVLRLHPHEFPFLISRDYRLFLDHKYSIRVMDTLWHVSLSTNLHVKQ